MKIGDVPTTQDVATGPPWCAAKWSMTTSLPHAQDTAFNLGNGTTEYNSGHFYWNSTYLATTWSGWMRVNILASAVSGSYLSATLMMLPPEAGAAQSPGYGQESYVAPFPSFVFLSWEGYMQRKADPQLYFTVYQNSGAAQNVNLALCVRRLG